MTINNKVTIKSQMNRHTAVAKKYEGVALEVHVLACEDLIHAREHGDVTLCQHLFNTLGGVDKGSSFSHTRVEALKEWFRKMSGGQITSEGGTWKMLKGWNASKFLSEEEIENTPYWKLTPEKKVQAMTIMEFLKTMKGYIKKFEKADEEGNFKGDFEAAKRIVSEVINLADERVKRLTTVQTGEIELTADKLLEGTGLSDEMKAAVREHIEGEQTEDIIVAGTIEEDRQVA